MVQNKLFSDKFFSKRLKKDEFWCKNNSCKFFYFNWNDRRSRCVFLCFYSAILQRTIAKFQTFAYNSRTVGFSYMKFSEQFEINELYVCNKFRGNRSRDFGFRTRKPPRKVGVKSSFSQKRLKYGKKYFIWLYFYSNQPALDRDEFLFPFFSS